MLAVFVEHESLIFQVLVLSIVPLAVSAVRAKCFPGQNNSDRVHFDPIKMAPARLSQTVTKKLLFPNISVGVSALQLRILSSMLQGTMLPLWNTHTQKMQVHS